MQRGEIIVPPVSVQLQIAEAAIELQQLAFREAVVARGVAKNSDALLDGDIEALAAMAMRLEQEMAVAEQHTEFLRRTFEQFGPWVNERASGSLGSAHFEPEQVEQITSTLKAKDEDFSALGLSLADSAAKTIPGSRKELRDSAFDFKGKESAAVDWHHVGCTMIDLAILGGLVTCFPTEGAGCAVALAATVAHAALC